MDPFSNLNQKGSKTIPTAVVTSLLLKCRYLLEGNGKALTAFVEKASGAQRVRRRQSLLAMSVTESRKCS